MTGKRKRYSADFKAKVGGEAASGKQRLGDVQRRCRGATDQAGLVFLAKKAGLVDPGLLVRSESVV